MKLPIKIKLIFYAFAFEAVLVGSTSAAEYVCMAQYEPSTSSMGNYGSVVIFTNSGPHCSGYGVGTRTLCTAQATAPGCPVSTIYTEDGLLKVLDKAVDAAEKGMQVSGSLTFCKNNVKSCWSNITFYGSN